MISPQEAGKPSDAASYSWSPFGPHIYWRKRIGEEIATELQALLDTRRNDLCHCVDALTDAINIARGITND